MSKRTGCLSSDSADTASDSDHAADAPPGSFIVDPADAGTRLDRYLAVRIPDLSRTAIQRLITNRRILVDGGGVRPSHALRECEHVAVERTSPESGELAPEDVSLDVQFEDDHLIVLAKPAAMVVHPGTSVSSGTLVNALLHHFPPIRDVGDPSRPGIVHRLDRDTTGLMIVAKSQPAYEALVELLRTRRVRREYLALVAGDPPPAGVIDAPIGRSPRAGSRFTVGGVDPKDAVTHFELAERFDVAPGQSLPFALLLVRLETGRTHQIRVHLAHVGLPVVGDPTYGRGARRAIQQAPPTLVPVLSALERQLLHSCALRFDHPLTKRSLSFSAVLPYDFTKVIDQLRACCSEPTTNQET